MTPYHYGLLRPVRAVGAGNHNALWLGATTLGIEVTEPELATACGLGNIDPQHLDRRQDIAAIDAALSWPLAPAGSKLVTIRPDADAYGSMAVLALRAEGTSLSDDALARIALVSKADRFANGPWPGRRPLPACADEIDEVGVGPQNLGAMVAGFSRQDMTTDVAVDFMKRWILEGAAPEDWCLQANEAAETLISALRSGRVVVREAVPGQIAVVEGSAPGALRVGYRRAPVLAAVATLQERTDAAPLRKITIAQYAPGYVDLAAAARTLSLAEPGWGGSATIIGSPQGANCAATIEHCIDVLRNSRV